MGPRFRRDDKTPDSIFKQPTVGRPSLRGAKQSVVVPAHAGTHTPRPAGLAQWVTASAPTNDGGYGSPLSRGRQNSRFNFQTANCRTVIASEAKQSMLPRNRRVDCFVAALLAMTRYASAFSRRDFA